MWRRLHARCAGLDPQISPLPGHDFESAYTDGGFFDCLKVRHSPLLVFR